MNFRIEPPLFEKFPGLHVGLLIAKNVDSTAKSSAALVEQLRAAEKDIVNTLDLETFREHPKLAALQEAHRAFGNNPNKFPPSIQALSKRILKGGQLPSITPLVDAYNVISLRYLVPVGCEDLDICQGDIRLAEAIGNEEFRTIGAEENDPPLPGEIVYKDDVGVICRKFNWREGDRTKLTDKTTNAVFVIEAMPPVTVEELASALSDLEELVQSHCGGEMRREILSTENPETLL